jgi:predicted DNA-binding transcriptional regulator AlpA
MSDSQITPRFMTAAEVHKALKISRTTLYKRWNQQPNEVPPYVELGGKRLVSVEDFEAFIKNLPRKGAKLN